MDSTGDEAALLPPLCFVEIGPDALSPLLPVVVAPAAGLRRVRAWRKGAARRVPPADRGEPAGAGDPGLRLLPVRAARAAEPPAGGHVPQRHRPAGAGGCA